MPQINCQQCFPERARLNLPEINPNAFNYLNCINQQHAYGPAVQSGSSMRAAGPGTVDLKKMRISDIDAHLSKWVNSAENEDDKKDRLSLASAFKAVGATLKDKQIIVAKSIDLQDLGKITALPNNLRIKGNFNLSGATNLKEIPKNLIVDGTLELQECAKLESYPATTKVGKDVILSKCNRLTTLPENHTFKRDLILYKCTALKELPEKMTVGDRFELKGCTQLNKMPKQLSVGGTLDMTNCIRVEHLPRSLVLGRNLYLENCQLIQKLPSYVYGLGDVQTSRGRTNRIINVQGTFLNDRDNERTRFERVRGITFETGASRHPISVKVVTEPGKEAEDILKYIRHNPQEDLYIQYKGEKGIDIGGLSRQAFENAFNQLLDKKDGLFTKGANGLYSLAEMDYTSDKQVQLLQEANAVAAILSKMLYIGISTGHRFESVFFEHLYETFENFEHMLPKGKDAQSTQQFIIDNFVEVKNPTETIALMQKVLPSLYGKPSQVEYLKSLDKSELKEQTINICSYMSIVGLSMIVVPDYKSVEDLTFIIAGPQDSTKRFSDSLVAKTARPEDQALAQTMFNWIKEAVRQSRPDQIRDITKDLTGSSYFSSVKIDLTMNLTRFTDEDKHLLFKSHSCGFTLDVNVDIFKGIVKRKDKDDFITAFLNSGTTRFMDA